jgi:hypothetical protein
MDTRSAVADSRAHSDSLTPILHRFILGQRREASFADQFRPSARSIPIVVASRPDVVVRLSRKCLFRLLISSHKM